jgi:hypothetical protein
MLILHACHVQAAGRCRYDALLCEFTELRFLITIEVGFRNVVTLIVELITREERTPTETILFDVSLSKAT